MKKPRRDGISPGEESTEVNSQPKSDLTQEWWSQWEYNDGGRAAAGFKGYTGDCACRAVAIATEQPYKIVYDALNSQLASMRQTKGIKRSSSRTGMNRRAMRKYMEKIGWEFVPLMGIGTGCKIHLRGSELPMGRIICQVSRHVVAAIDGVIHDTGDCSREGTRCVYGYYQKAK